MLLRGGILARIGSLAAGAFGLLSGCDSSYVVTRVDSMPLMSAGERLIWSSGRAR